MNDLIELLSNIPPSSLEYQEWINVGMALKHEGYPASVWDDWSRADARYKDGLCEKKWSTFREDSDKIVTGGTIYNADTTDPDALQRALTAARHNMGVE